MELIEAQVSTNLQQALQQLDIDYFIKSSNNNIYIDVLYLFEKDYIETNITNYYNNYLKENEWLPKLIKNNYKSIFDDENYDVYCEYVKLKKSSV